MSTRDDHAGQILSRSVRILERLTIGTTSMFEEKVEEPPASKSEAEFREQCAWIDAELWAISQTNEDLFNEIMTIIDGLQIQDIALCHEMSSLIDPRSCTVNRLYIQVETAEDFVNIVPIDIPRANNRQSIHDVQERIDKEKHNIRKGDEANGVEDQAAQ